MFRKRLRPKPIKIQEDGTNLSIQERLLLEQRYYSLSKLDEANESIDGKAMTLIQASSLIFALIGALRFPDIIYTPSFLALAAIFFSFLSFGTMIYFATKVWMPGDYDLPGTNNWDDMFDDYLWVSSSDCFNKILSNCTEAYSRLKNTNKLKSGRLTTAMYLFLFQIIGLLIVATLA